MKRVLTVVLAVPLLVTLLGALALAQDQEYALKDYMPRTVGSKWTLKTTNDQGDTTITYEVDKARDVGGQQVTPILTKDANGNLMRGSLEIVSEDNLTILGSIFVPRGQQAGGAPFDALYTSAAIFPGKLKMGQSEEAKVKTSRGGQEMDITIKLELAAVESVTVPKGTFDGCLKVVTTTSFGRGEMKRTAWYAKGVGLVRTESGGFGNRPPRIAELTDYQLAQ